MPTSAVAFRVVCGGFLPVFIGFMAKRVKLIIAMRYRTLTLRSKLDGATTGFLLALLYFGILLQLCGDIELNPGPPKQDPLQQTQLASAGQRRNSVNQAEAAKSPVAASSAAGGPTVARQGQGPSMATPVHPDVMFWRQRVQEWFPGLYGRTYFLPPVFMNRTQRKEVQVAGVTVHVTEPPVSNMPRGAAPALQESDVRDDITQVKVLSCLHQLSEVYKEVMFVISQLEFGNYLNQPAYAAATLALPTPIDLKSLNKHRGDFDVLIILRHYGILVGEIKTIGDKFSSMTQQQQDQKIAEKVKLAIRQLQKTDDVLVHLVSDQSTAPRILKTLMLPNITTVQLQSVLTANPQLSQDLCQCLGATITADPSPMCLTSDVLNNPGQWWQQLVKGAGTDPAMTDSVYLDLIARFGGPATTVTVACTSQPRLHMDMRSKGEGVSETGWQFTQLVLHPRQLSILNSSERFVYLAGPPGCGKSSVLMLKALDWICQGKPALVVSVWKESVAASHMLFHQLQQTAGPAASTRLQLYTLDVGKPGYDEGSAQSDVTNLLASVPPTGQLLVIADEVTPITLGSFDVFNELHRQCHGLHLWTAGLYHLGCPVFMNLFPLTEPLRSPPCVTREVRQALSNMFHPVVQDYTVVPSPLPCDGPALRVMLHTGHGHNEEHEACQCYQCGMEIARALQELHVGISTSSSPPPLRYRDVFLLSVASPAANFKSPEGEPCGMLNGLRDAGVPVTVLNKGDASAMADVVTMSGTDHVTAADVDSVTGLERPVVVWVEDKLHTAATRNYGKVFAMSRCTAQLIWVKSPPSHHQ